MDRDMLLEMFAPMATDEELAEYTLDDLERQIAEMRASEPDTCTLSNRQIAQILREG